MGMEMEMEMEIESCDRIVEWHLNARLKLCRSGSWNVRTVVCGIRVK